MAHDRRMLLRTILLAALLAATPALPAEPPPASEAEIQHLLDYLGDSGCQFFRNGAWHPARDARAHIQKKYAYLLDKSMVKTAEDFIARAAAESSTSGRPYQVRCAGGEPVTSAKWLEAELARYRQIKPAPK
ncbi:MAG: DUF5329 domain-containing protein [Burkholderiales bacterium]